MKSRCCCGPSSPCETEDCELVRDNCCDVGLQPFRLQFEATMNKTTCSEYNVTMRRCEMPNCLNWLSFPCMGCNWPVPGCPPFTSICQTPAGREYPFKECTKGIAGSISQCLYGHPDYWYTLLELGGGPCDVPTEPDGCEGTCNEGIGTIPAGYTAVQCRGVTVATELEVNELYSCTSVDRIELPATQCEGIYGWPIDCEFLGNPCDCDPCTCRIGTLGTFNLMEENSEGCASRSASVLITFAVPCADTAGSVLCGFGCDDCPSSYIGLQIGMMTRTSTDTYGSESGFAELPLETWCEANGYTNPTTPVEAPDYCDANSYFAGMCDEQCCECENSWYVVLRKRRTAADGNTCTMAKGTYEIVATSQACGNSYSVHPCGDATEFPTPCVDGVSACADPAAWSDYFEKMGLQLKVSVL